MKLLAFIDDDPILEFTTKIFLEEVNPDMEMVSFTRANSALEYFEKHQFSRSYLPDLLLLDIHMPGMDGWQFLERFENLCQNLEKIPLIHVMSSSLNFRDRERAHEHPLVKSFIAKPIFKETIRKLMVS